ncbi:hypothetical protein BKA93DRAFT_830841 [Sparassis latifolia]
MTPTSLLCPQDISSIDRAAADALTRLSITSTFSSPSPSPHFHSLRSSSSQEAPKTTMSVLIADAGAMPGPLCEGPLGMPIQVKGETLYHVEQVRETGMTDHWYKAAAATQFYQNAKLHSFHPLLSTPLKLRCTRKAEKKAAQRHGEKTYVMFRGLAPGPGVYETWDEVKAMCIGVSGSLYQQALIALLPPSAQLEQIPYDCTNIQLLFHVGRKLLESGIRVAKSYRATIVHAVAFGAAVPRWP